MVHETPQEDAQKIAEALGITPTKPDSDAYWEGVATGSILPPEDQPQEAAGEKGEE